MTVVLAFLIGALYAAGIYLLMRRSFVKLVIGLTLMAHAANLLIFTASGLDRGLPAFIGSADTATTAGAIADPLPQALILTAIVIGFGLQAFALVLLKRTYQTVGTDDLNMLQATDEAAWAGKG